MRPIACRDSFFSLSGSLSLSTRCRLLGSDVLLNEVAKRFVWLSCSMAVMFR